MRPLIGLVLETFPKVSETFILNEILELERQGLDVHIFSLKRPSAPFSHPNVAKVNAQVTYLPSLLPTFDRNQEKALVSAQVALFEQDSTAYLHTLKRYLNRDHEQRFNEYLQGGYLAWKLQELGIKHLHAHFADVTTATVEIAQAFSGVSYSMTAHTKDTYLRDKAVLNRRMAKAEFIFTCSESNRRYLEQVSTSDTPIHVAYHGVDIASFNPAPKIQPSPVPLILSIGRFCESTGFTYLLKACHLIKQKGVAFNCVIIGDGHPDASIRQHINDLNLEQHITLVEECSQQQRMAYYQQADLFVLPYLVDEASDHDGIPNVLLEAMAMELPVVTTNVVGISELMQSHYNGIIVSEKDALCLTQAMEVLLIQSKFAKTLGKTGRLTVLDKFGLVSNVGAVKDSLLRAAKQPMRSNCQSHGLENLIRLAAS